MLRQFDQPVAATDFESLLASQAAEQIGPWRRVVENKARAKT
jgi:hypothetical protein